MLLLASSTSSCSLRYFLVACVLVAFVALVVRTSLLALLCRLMARVKKTAMPVEGFDVADSGSDVVLSFEFGPSRVM